MISKSRIVKILAKIVLLQLLIACATTGVIDQPKYKVVDAINRTAKKIGMQPEDGNINSDSLYFKCKFGKEMKIKLKDTLSNRTFYETPLFSENAGLGSFGDFFFSCVRQEIEFEDNKSIPVSNQKKEYLEFIKINLISPEWAISYVFDNHPMIPRWAKNLNLIAYAGADAASISAIGYGMVSKRNDVILNGLIVFTMIRLAGLLNISYIDSFNEYIDLGYDYSKFQIKF